MTALFGRIKNKPCCCRGVIDLPYCLCSPLAEVLNFTIAGSGTGMCSFSGEMTFTTRFFDPSWISEAFTLPTNPTPTEVKLKLTCIQRPEPYPNNGFTEEDIAEVNTPFWYNVSFILADESGTLTTAIPGNYREPDTLNGWVGRCRDGFLVVTYFLNTLCGGVGDGLLTVVITE